MKFVILLLILSACGPIVQVNNPVQSPAYAGAGIDDAFFTQVLTFETEWGRHVTNVDMFFVDRLDGSEIGTCIFVEGSGYQRAIRIERDTWDRRQDSDFREALIMHELGHCQLNLDHDDSVDEDGCAKSLMYPSMDRVWHCYAKKRRYYLDGLFGRPQN